MSFVEMRQKQIRRRALAGEVVTHLSSFERDLGRALSSGSRLIGFLPEARTEAHLSNVVGQEAIRQFLASISLVSQAMEQAADGHRYLDGIRRDLRIPESAGGDKIPLPPISGQLDQAPERGTEAIAC